MNQKKANQPPTYRARLRFRFAKKIDIEAYEYRFMVAGRTVDYPLLHWIAPFVILSG